MAGADRLKLAAELAVRDITATLVDLAVRFGAEREETAARLGAYQYLVVAGKKS